MNELIPLNLAGSVEKNASNRDGRKRSCKVLNIISLDLFKKDTGHENKENTDNKAKTCSDTKISRSH